MTGSGSSFFEEASQDPSKLNLPDYCYNCNINTPEDLGISDKGSFSAMSKNVSGLLSYVDLIVSGKGPASKTGKPLGDKVLLDLGTTCKDNKTGQTVKLYNYINNVSAGRNTGLSEVLGGGFTELNGLLPQVIGKIADLNPIDIMGGFMTGSNPKCTSVDLPLINSENQESTQNVHLSDVEIKGMDPCDFVSKRNPITKETCQENFVGSRENKNKKEKFSNYQFENNYNYNTENINNLNAYKNIYNKYFNSYFEEDEDIQNLNFNNEEKVFELFIILGVFIILLLGLKHFYKPA